LWQEHQEKMVLSHHWLTTMPAAHSMPLPFPSDKKTLALRLNCPTPGAESEKMELEKKMGI
jgi:hypothetical protein